MKSHHGRNHEIPVSNTASMPDLVFLILFFFMLVVHMRKANVHIEYQVSMATGLSRVYNNSTIQHIYTGRPINGLGQVEGEKMVVQLNNHITTIPEVKKYLIQLSAALPPEQCKELSVNIKADHRTSMGTIMDPKQVLREANALNVNFTATMSRNNKLK